MQIIDPFVGTGNFIVRIMHEINLLNLQDKYLHDLHCNEVMLLPYYIAATNIEQAYSETMGQYKPFKGICLADTLELAEKRQATILTENTARVNRQKASPIFVIIGNPPYNAKQLNENDNNKNRKHTAVEKWIADTYAKDSKAANKNALSDPYVKAIMWANNRLKEHSEGVVALVTNNAFLNCIAFDGMRQHLAHDFSKIYVLNLGGNVRENSKLSGTTHNVFGIQVGISISFLVKKKNTETHKIFYASLAEDWRKEAKYRYLHEKQSIAQIDWQTLVPNQKQIWLSEGLHPEFDHFIPLGTKTTKIAKTEVEGVIFKIYSRGVATCRDMWACNFSQLALAKNMQRSIKTYNEHVFKWTRHAKKQSKFDDFVLSNESNISWSDGLKNNLRRGKIAQFDTTKIRQSLYRPFTKVNRFFDRVFNERVYLFPSIFPTPSTEIENKVICCTNHSQSPFVVQITNCIPDVAVGGRNGQCFPFYTYNENGSNRKENITDWALKHYRQHYQNDHISKWDIFHYVYGLLHHPHYRKKYAANLKREIPRIPLVSGFWTLVKAGQQLADLHLNYENQPEYPLKFFTKLPMNWRVEKMKFCRGEIVYNNSLTIGGIPPETFDYRLGNRSALVWVIDQHRLKTEQHNNIINDPNRLEDKRYIVRLIGQIVTVSLKTVEIMKELQKSF